MTLGCAAERDMSDGSTWGSTLSYTRGGLLGITVYLCRQQTWVEVENASLEIGWYLLQYHQTRGCFKMKY